MKKFFSRLLSNKQNINSLVFEIDSNNNTLDIKVIIGDTSNDASKYLSTFLHDLNHGKYAQKILDVLLKIGNDKTNYPFVYETVAAWGLKAINTENELSNDQPIVSPSQFCGRVSK